MTSYEDLAEQIRMCAACPKMCRHVCPTFFAWRSDSPTPHGRALLIHQELIGTRRIDDRGIEVLFQCLECSHCLTWCKPEIDIAAIVESKRRELVTEGRRPDGLTKMASTIEKYHNPYSESHEGRNQWLKAQRKKSDRTVLYFVGCTSSYKEREIAQNTVELLEFLGISVIVSSNEWCCGSPLLRTGDTALGMELALHNVEFLNKTDADEIIVTCPGCFRVLSKDYAALGYALNKPVRHISQLLDEFKDDLPVLENENTVTYHDPCHLGRHSGVYDEPRNVINRVSNFRLVEMERTRNNAMCCGNGAGLRTLFPDHAKLIGKERIRQAKETGAAMIVTSCPFCKNMLKSEAGDDLLVVDLPDLVMMAKKSRKPKVN
jgi:heterodisulfide reductase subunit D